MFPKFSQSTAALIASISTAIAGLLVLIGWQLDITILKTFGLGAVTMKPNGAVFFLLSGLTLLLLQFSNPITKWLSRIFSSLIILAAFLTLAEFIFLPDFGIDELLFSVEDTTGFVPHPSRIAFNAAINFVLLGMVLFYLSLHRPRLNYFIEFCLMAAFSISAVGLLNFVSGFSDSAGATGYYGMAVNAATLFIALCLGIYFTIRRRIAYKFAVEQKLFAGLTISATIIVFVSFLFVSNLRSMHEAVDLVQHIHIVKNQVENILTATIDIETGSRGFLLSGKEYFLKKMVEAKRNIPEQIAGLRNLTKDNPNQQYDINTLERLIIEKIERSDLAVNVRKSKGITEAILLIEAGRGQNLTDSIRTIKDQMIAEQNQLLSLRNKAEDERMAQTQNVIFIGFLFQIFLLALMFLFVKTDISGKRKAQKELLTLLEDLEEIVEERTAELKQSEEKVIQERDKANQYLDTAGVMLVLLDSTGKVSKINIKGCEVLGYSENEIVGKDWFKSFLPKNLVDGAHSGFKKIMEGKIEALEFYEIPIVNKNGEERLIEWHNILLRNAEGKPTGTLSSGEDITERKQVEEALRTSELHFRKLFESNPQPMWVYDLETFRFLDVNNTAVKKYGYTRATFLSMTLKDIRPPEDVPSLNLNIAEATNKIQESGIWRHKLNDGTIIFVEIHSHDLKFENRQARLVLVNDITERKKAENQKHRQSEILEAIITGVPLPTILEQIVKSVEEEDPTSLCSILLLDDEGKHLLNGAAPSLPEFYNQAIEGIEIGEKVGSCGAAASTKIRIIAEDLLTHPNWAAYTELTQRANLRSCWSEPILDAENNVLGTFAIYHREPQTPLNEEIELLKSVVSLASLAITRKRNEEQIRNMNAELEIKVEERTEQLAETNENLLKEMEERRQIEDRFKLVVESAPNAIILVDSSGTIQLINKQTENYFGYERDELIGKKIEMLVPNASEMNHVNLHSDFTSHPTERKMGNNRDLFGLKKDGSKIPIEVGLNPIRINNETLILTSIIDITERKKAEEEIKNAKTEAERANIAKSEFLSRMSHELRTPLNSILGFTQLMSMGELNPAHKKGVDHIMKSGKHLLNLINEVLDLSRIEAGKLSISIEPIQLQKVLGETLDILNYFALERSIKLELESSPNNDLFVKADHQKLKQVLLNIVNNAVKYNKEGGLVTVKVANIQNETARISITDTGNGISPDELHKLYSPFQRIGVGISEIEGTGLGLAVAKKLMEAMNGSIGLESEPGVGSTFWIELPQIEGQIERHERNGDFIKPDTKTVNVSGTLLYIENNISNQQLVKQIIDTQRPSINLITETFGKNTVKLAKDYKPDLILLDLNLPDIHGSEVLKLLLKDTETKSIPVVILSADAMEKQIEKSLIMGAKLYLTKPLDVLELLKAIDECLNV
ncbi:MAG: PAS domain S-box protein [Flavobacteriaceae bacterium]|nr:PAS domain S-box protein [Flavobacteriaceae bacterium]